MKDLEQIDREEFYRYHVTSRIIDNIKADLENRTIDDLEDILSELEVDYIRQPDDTGFSSNYT